MRITRGAESFYHSIINIEEKQKNNYPIVALEGMSHSSFMDKTMLPSGVVNKDLKPEVEENDGYKKVGKAMSSFIGEVIGPGSGTEGLNGIVNQLNDTSTFFAPLVKAMELENSYNIKDPCYNSNLVNPDLPTCLHGSKWTEMAQSIMGGEIGDKQARLNTIDNFHRVYTVNPVHLP